MKILKKVLKKLVKEAVEGDRLIPERPWSVEYSFTLSGGTASDSEGQGPDGFAIVMTSDNGKTVRIVVDAYWNPTSGDESGNSIKMEYDGQQVSTYVPVRFDDGNQQKLIISNTPVPGIMSVSHASSPSSLPIIYLVMKNPFDEDEDVTFDVETLGNGQVDVKMTGHTNL